MMRRLNEVHLERGRLLERITTQRYVLINEVQPVRAALDKVDHVRAQVEVGVGYVKRYPAVAGLAAVVLAVMNFRRTVRLVQRGFVAWRMWRMLRERFAGLAGIGWPGFR